MKKIICCILISACIFTIPLSNIKASEISKAEFIVEETNDLESYLSSIFAGEDGFSAEKNNVDVMERFIQDINDLYEEGSFDEIAHYLNINEIALCRLSKNNTMGYGLLTWFDFTPML